MRPSLSQTGVALFWSVSDTGPQCYPHVCGQRAAGLWESGRPCPGSSAKERWTTNGFERLSWTRGRGERWPAGAVRHDATGRCRKTGREETMARRAAPAPDGPRKPPVGRVLGTADATPLQFWVAVAPEAYLQLDDVVVTERELPDQPPVTIAGVVTAVRARHDSALYFDRMRRQVPMGTGRDGAPVFLNAEFLDGSRGAHVSISGISGVATKTSFATFLLYSVFHSGVLGGSGEAANTRALIFNVKGEDLLFLDHPNT